MESKDSLFIRAAVSYGFISQDDVANCIAIQQERKEQGKETLFEDIAKERGLLSGDDIGKVYDQIHQALQQSTKQNISTGNAAAVVSDDSSCVHTEVISSASFSPSQPPRHESPKSQVSIGGKVGRYHVTQLLGRGGMGAVYKATDPSLARPVAIKVLLDAGEMGALQIDRFKREAQATASLQHPNIVGIYDFYEPGDGSIFLIMECVEGRPLSDIIRERAPLPIEEAILIARQVGEALHAAHQLNIVHRDIKPANILITPSGQAKVTDFGLAKVTSCASLSGSGQIVGTPYYISPEQVAGEKVDGRCDIYSLGITLYQMLTGKLPFVATNMYNLLIAHLEHQPIPITEYNAKIPDPLVQIINSMMAKDKEKRFQSAKGVVEALNKFAMGDETLPPLDTARAIVPSAISYPTSGVKAYGMRVDSGSTPKKTRIFRSIFFGLLIFFLIFPVVIWKMFPKTWQWLEQEAQFLYSKIQKAPPSNDSGQRKISWYVWSLNDQQSIPAFRLMTKDGLTCKREQTFAEGSKQDLTVEFRKFENLFLSVEIPPGKGPLQLEANLVPLSECRLVVQGKANRDPSRYEFLTDNTDEIATHRIMAFKKDDNIFFVLYVAKKCKILRVQYDFYYTTVPLHNLPMNPIALTNINVALLQQRLQKLSVKTKKNQLMKLVRRLLNNERELLQKMPSRDLTLLIETLQRINTSDALLWKQMVIERLQIIRDTVKENETNSQ